jgi:hypothetical protein
MKTNFALGLTQDGITLWQRDGSGWLRVGAAALDDPDMGAAMAAIVDKAHKLAPEGLATKLVIPEEHLLMTNLHAPGPGRDAQEVQIRAGLAGRTPFPVEELVFDWSGAGTTVSVAVVARETLIEAEDFAQSQGLNPVCFVAAIAPDGFRGEPFFGLTRDMRKQRVDPANVQRDGMVLRETGVARLPEPVVAPEPVADAPALPDAPTDRAPAVQNTPAPIADVVAVDPAAAPEPEAQPTATVQAPQIVVPNPPRDTAEPQNKTLDDVAKRIALAVEPTPPTEPIDQAKVSANIGFRTRRQIAPAVAPDTAPPVIKVQAAPAPVVTPELDKSFSAALVARTGVAKWSGTTTDTKPPSARLTVLTDKLRNSYSQTNAVVISKIDNLRKSLVRPKSIDGTAKPAPTPDDAISAITTAIAAKADLVDAAAKPIFEPKAGAGASVKPTSTAPARKSPLETLRKVQATSSAPHPASKQKTEDEAQRMTVFGARGASVDLGKPPVPRQALLITGGVLLVFVAAAIWALYFTAATPEQTATPETAAPDIAAPADIVLPTDATDLAAIEAALGADDAAQAERVAEDGSDLRALPADPLAPTALTARDTDAAAGVDLGDAGLGGTTTAPLESSADTVQAPPRDTDAGRIAEIRSNQIIAPQEQSGALDSPSPPAPFGADPLPPLRNAEATPAPEADSATGSAPDTDMPVTGEEGVTITVTDGRPPSTPPAKPARFAQPEAPTAPETAPEQVAPQEQGSIPPALQQAPEAGLTIRVTQGPPAVVPPRRTEPTAQDAEVAPDPAPDNAALPEGTVPPPDTDTATDLATATQPPPPPGGISLSGLRPAARPSDLRQIALPTPEPEVVFPSATAQAVETSIRPNSRPSQFAQTVQRALAAATPRQTTAPPPAAEAVQTASAAAAMPRLPTATSVAREATVSRAINLRQVNLLGVMGTSTNRRALVRLSNGRVVTVRVGESLDDGQVTAIGDSELRYVRRGRDVVLRIAS